LTPLRAIGRVSLFCAGSFVGDARVSSAGEGPQLSGLAENHALLLDGNGDYVTTSLETEAQFADAATVIAWVYLDTQPGDKGQIFQIASKKRVGNDLDLQIETDNFPRFFTDWDSSTTYATTLPTQEWVHLAAVFDDQADFRGICRDGQLVAETTPYTRDRSPSTATFSIAESLVWGPRCFAGRPDEFAVYERALTSIEIRSIYEAGVQASGPRATLSQLLVNGGAEAGDLSGWSAGPSGAVGAVESFGHQHVPPHR